MNRGCESESRPPAAIDVGFAEVAMASSFAVSGPVLLHALWTGDLRYLPDADWLALAAAWSLGLTMTAFSVFTAYRLWRQTGR